MTVFATLLGKEIRSLFYSPIAYVVIAVFLLLMGYTFTSILFLNKTATLIHVFFQAATLLLLLVPVITMRLFAEERRVGTLELLLTSPVREIEVVLAKYLASLLVVAVMLVLTLPYPITLEIFGEPAWGPVYSGYLGLILLGATLVASGTGRLRRDRQPDCRRGGLLGTVPDPLDARHLGAPFCRTRTMTS